MSKKKSRRDFIVIASYSMGAVGAGVAIWPIINQMNPAADTLAMASTEVNIGALEISIKDKIGLNVKIRNIKKNNGTISFEFKDLDQLNRIIDIIKANN